MIRPVPQNLKEDGEVDKEWKDIEAAVFQSFTVPRRSATLMVKFLREVRNAVRSGLSASPAKGDPKADSKLKKDLADLTAKVAELTTVVATLKVTVDYLTEPVAVKSKTSASQSEVI